MGNWDVSNVTTMANMFLGATSFNQPLNDWGAKTSNVTDMSRMFYVATKFNQPINSWNVSSVTTFYQMFYSALQFNGSVSGWAPSSATNMQQMFGYAYKFNQPIDWTATASVTNMQQMFTYAYDFNQSLASLNTSSVTNMNSMFSNATDFNGDVSTWNTANVTNMASMFTQAASFNNASGLSAWNTGNVTSMASMFSYAPAFNQPLATWNTGKVTDMSVMFQYAPAFNQPLNAWDVSKVTNMSRMFEGASTFNQDLNSWNTGNVAGGGMTYMFYLASDFDGQVSNWNTSKVTDFSWLFRQASAFNQDVSGWDTSSVTNFTDTFRSTRFRGDVTSWNVTKATTMSGMFSSITPDSDVSGLRGTPWLNRTLIAWSQQAVRPNVTLNFSDTGGGGFPKYTAGAYSLGSEAAYDFLTRSTAANPNPGKGWNIQTGGTTAANTPGQPLNLDVNRSGAEDNGADAVINWSKPVDGDTASPLTYRVEATTDSNVGCTVSPALSPDSQATTCSISGMTVNVFYQFTVTAVNSTGDSEPSDPPLPTQNIGPLTPALGTPTPTPDGFTVPITNYNGQYQWSGTATQNGSVTVADGTGIATIRGVAPDTTSIATITASRFAYTDQSSTVSGTSLKAALNPAFETPVRTPDGFTAKITNYDGVNYGWAATALPGPGTATIVEVSGEHFLRVTDLLPNVEATVTVSTTRDGYAPGSTEVVDSSLRSALTPTFGPAEATANGFSAVITNYDDQYTWAATLPDGSPGVVEIVEDEENNTHSVVVSGLDPAVTVTTTVTASRTDSVQGSATVTDTSLDEALVPTLGTPQPTATGFTVEITNYDNAWTFTGTATADGTVTVNGAIATVTGVAPDTESEVTITSHRDDYANGQATTSATSLKAALVPDLQSPVSTPDGYTMMINNYDSPTYTWVATVTSAEGSASIQAVEGGHAVVVVGLDPDDPATVVVTTNRAGYATGSVERTASSLKAKLDPTFGPVVRTDDGFTAQITNYDSPTYAWNLATSAGSVSRQSDGGSEFVVVTGLPPNTSATVTVTTTREGYAGGSNTVSGTSLLAAYTPELGDAVATASGFTSEIENYDDSYTWNPSITTDPVPQGASVSITLVEGVHYVTVTGMAANTAATVEVTTTLTNHATGEASVSGTSLLAALTPSLAPAVKTNGGFTSVISNYDPAYTWGASSTSGTATITSNGGVFSVTVSGLGTEATATATVTTTRDGYASGSAQVTSTSNKDALTPAFGPVVRTAGGFTSQITNYDDDYQWGESTSAGTVWIAEEGGLFYVQVTGLAANTPATATITTSREGYANGSNTVTGTSLMAALTPDLAAPVATPDGFTAQIENYNADYVWNASITSDPIPQGATASITQNGSDYFVTVTGLAPNTEATATVTATRTNYITGSAAVSDTSLLAKLVPAFEEAVQTPNGFTAVISNYDGAYVWDASVNLPSPAQASITNVGAVYSVTVSGLDPATSAVATVTTEREGYADGSAELADSSQQVALEPELATPTRTAGGFTALITNYDDDFDWDATIKDGTPVGAAAAITESGSDHFLTVTGLAPNTDATAIVTTTQDGYVPGAEEVTATSLLAARTPTFGPTVQTDDGFTAAITNYDGDFVWDASITSMPVPGGATAEVDEVSGTHYLIVSGLAADVTVTATVTATQDDYAPGSAAVIASSLKSALTPEFGTITRTDGGFTVPVTNYDDAFDWPATWNGGSTEVGSDGVLVVTGLADSEEVTVTVEAVQDGYVTGSNTVIGEAAETELTPEFGTPTATDGGFTVPVTNYSGDYVWNLSATAGTAVLNTSGNPVLVVVTGLSVGQSSTVTATTTRTNYITGSNTVTGMSLQASLTPTFGAVSRTPEGFTALITNYNSDYVWDASSTVGDAEVVGDGQTASVVVTNVPTGGATATATVTTTRTGYFDGSANVTGRSTLAALTPQFATPERGVNGFTVQITNYDPDYTWSADLENGLPAGASAAMTTQGPNHFVTVTGLADGADATAIVTTVVPGDPEVNASAGVESAALDAPLVPTFGTAVPTDGGFTVPITNYSGDYEWDLSPSAGSASIDTSGTPTLVVTGLSVGQTSVVTVTTTQEGFQDGSAQATGMSLQAAFNPTFGAVTRTDGGFTAPISNYVAGFTMIASMDPDIQDASAVVSGSGVLTVTGLPDGQQIQVTVATSQAGYFDGTGTVNGAALDAAYNPEFENVTATNDGFTAEVSNYEAGYEWSVEADPGTASINYDANPVLLTVTGLTTGQSSTVTVGTTKSTSLPGAGSVTGTATQEALTPAFGTVVRNETGFTVPITNYSEDFTWNANATEGTASVVPVDATTANLVVTNLPGSELSTVTVTTNRTGFFGGSAQVTGRSTLKARTPVLGEPVRDVEKFTVEIDNYDPDYEWVATIQTGGPAGAVADIDEVSGTHYAVVTGLADGEEATVVVTTTAIGAPSVTASATKTSSALNAAWVPAFGVVTPTDGGFTIEITNYDDDFDWTPVAAPGSASIDTSDQVDLLVVTGLGVGQESTVTVTTTRSGYQTGSAQETGTSLQAAFNPTFGTVTRTDGGFTVPITNYVAGFTLTPSMDPVVQDAEAEVSDSGVLTVTGLPAGQQVQVTIATAQTGYFNGTGTVEGAALNAALPPVLGTPIPGNRSITVPIDNYDELYSWTPSATVGTAVVNTEMSPVSIVVTGLGPEETTLVNVVTTREGYLSATLAEPVEGTSDTGGQLNPVFGTTVATGDGLIAPITNYDPDFTWAASSSFGDAEVVEGEGDESGTWFLVVTGVDPVTSVVATVTTTRPKYDQGSASTSATTLKAALVPQTQNPSALSGAYTVEIAGYTSAYQWRAETDSGEWPIDDQGLVRVTGLTPGQTETLRIYSVRPGYGVGVTELTIAPLNAALTPQFSGYTPVLGGFSTQITNYDSAYTWTASASPGQATVNSAGLVTVTGLGSGTGSTVTVTASRTGYESGTSSSTGKALVQIPPAAPPSAPRVVQVKAVSGGKAKVTWAPTSYGGAPIDNAKATCKAGSSKKHKSGTAKTLTVAKLKKGKKYTCTVKVENIFGWSATSNKVKVKAK
ncbi:MAG: BspA family leucine-rich repeat surface protein [Candidatus Nanopelagicales bacterium]